MQKDEMSGKQTKSTRWWIRVDGPHEYLEERVKLIREWVDFTAISVGYHLGEKRNNPHAHFALMLKSEVQKQSMAARIKKLFNVTGAGQYSIEPWDGSLKVHSYLRHEPDAKVDYEHAMLTPEEHEQIKVLCEVYKDITTSAKEKAGHKCVVAALEAIEQGGKCWNPDEIVYFILEGVRDGKWYSPGNQMFRYIDEIFVRQGSNEVAKDNIRMLANKYASSYDRDGCVRVSRK